MPFRCGRAGACFCAGQGARSVVWLFQMSDEKRSRAQKQARPFGLRDKWRQAALQGLARERPLPAPCALPGAIWRSNAARRETATDPRCRCKAGDIPPTQLGGLRGAHIPQWPCQPGSAPPTLQKLGWTWQSLVHRLWSGWRTSLAACPPYDSKPHPPRHSPETPPAPCRSPRHCAPEIQILQSARRSIVY